MASSETPELLAARSTAAADSNSPFEREPALAASLADAEKRVERVLEEMPTAFVDARRLIGRELWPLPRPEELQTIIKIAADKEAEGPRRDLARRFLALRLVAEELTRAYWDPMSLDPGAIWCRAEDLQTVVDTVTRLEALLDPGPGAADLAFEDRVYLKTVAHGLAPRRDLINAAITLAPPFIEILEVAGVDDLWSRIPSLTKDELELLRRTAASAQGGGAVPDPSSAETSTGEGSAEDDVDPGADAARRHIALEVLTVRWLIHNDVAEWEELFREAAEMPSPAPQPDAADTPVHGSGMIAGPPETAAAGVAREAGAATREEPDEAWVVDEATPSGDGTDDSGVLDASGIGEAGKAPSAPAPATGRGPALTEEQIERRRHIHQLALRHQVLYGVVSERLQKIQDEALLMRHKEVTEWLAAFRRPLVASYSRLLTVVRDQAPGAPDPGAMTIPDDEPAESFEAIFEQAVTHADDKKAAEEAEKTALPQKQARRARMKRIALMAVALLGLGGVAVGVHFMIPKPPPDPLVFSPSEARNVISLSETRPIGTMLYAKLSGQWEPFSMEERQREIVSLARLAMERGFTSLYLVDESGEPLAEWDQTNGPKIFTHEPAN